MERKRSRRQLVGRRMMVRALALLTVTLAFAVAAPTGWAAPKYAAVVINADNGRVLHAWSAGQRRYPASLTKIMTLYMIFEDLRAGKITLKTRLKVSGRASRQPPSKLGLRRGDTITVKQAILALVTTSANDVATTVAENLSGSEAAFARRMTRRAHSLGMRRTHFRNASGLPHRRQVTTANDMATLAVAIQRQFPRYFGYFKTRSFRFKGRVYRNHNRLLGRYRGVNGIKTGYIRAAGFNLVSSVERDGKRLIGVVFGGRSGRSRDRQMVRLLDKGYKRLRILAAVKPPPRPRPRPKLTAMAAPAPVVPVASAATPWGIQVGAYANAGPATRATEVVRDRLPDLLRRAVTRVEGVTRGQAVIYRARLVGLSEVSARRACSLLRAEGLACVPVPGALPTEMSG